MGVITDIRDMWASRVEQSRVNREHLRTERMALEAANRHMEATARYVDRDDFDDFTSALGDAPRELNEQVSDTLRNRARRAVQHESSHLYGYVRNQQRFVIGKGPTITFEFESENKSEEKPKGEAAAKWWEMFVKANGFDELEDQIVHDTFVDGETFIRFFRQDVEGPAAGDGAAPAEDQWTAILQDVPTAEFDEPETFPQGMTHLRLVPPEYIKDPNGKVSHGILTARDDVETVLGYCYTPGQGSTKIADFIPASEIIHTKIRVGRDVKRGRSLLEPLLKRDRQWQDWMMYRITLSIARAAIVLVKKGTGGAVRGASIRDQQATTSATGNTRRQKMLKPMSTIHASKGTEYEYLSPDVQAQDAQHDGRALLLSQAAATGHPEYMFTGDASNSNMASTMVAESPAVREFEHWQDFFAPLFSRIGEIVIENGVESIDGLSESDLDQLTVIAKIPAMIARNRKEEAETFEIEYRNGVRSGQSWQEEVGLDPAEEKERIQQERERAIEFNRPPEPGTEE